MLPTELIRPILKLSVPFTNVLVALPTAMLMPQILRRRTPALSRCAAVAVAAALFGAYHLVCLNERAAQWLIPLSSPLLAVAVLIVLPAIYLPPGRLYRLFLIIPATVLILAVVNVYDAYSAVPEGKEGFYWLLISPVYLMGGLASLLVLLEPILPLATFRRVVRVTCLAVFLWGGFALRTSYTDYQAMLARRQTQPKGIMNLSDTSPVLQHDRRMLHLPAAPCRFTTDGGYVQGCAMEQFQRIMQVDYSAVLRLDPPAVQELSVLLGAMVLLAALLFLSGRIFCGWICPLSTLGDILNWLRRMLGLGHYKPAKSVKTSFLTGGLTLAGLTLAMAKAFPHLDEGGRFAGCKLPIYPFCKICPSQQICPVVVGGPDNYSGLPTWEWGWGFFTTACLGLLGIFLLCFIASRRLWCRLCPMGILAGVFNRGGMLRLVKNVDKCNQCGICSEICPMDVDRIRAETTGSDVTGLDCLLCLKCLEKCPRDGCLSLKHGPVAITESKLNRWIPRRRKQS